MRTVFFVDNVEQGLKTAVCQDSVANQHGSKKQKDHRIADVEQPFF